MLGGGYAAFAYSKPLGVAQFVQDTHSLNFTSQISGAARPEVRDWTAGWAFSRLTDFLAFFQDMAVQNNFVVNRQGATIDCASAATCTYDPRTPRAFANDTFYSDNTNQFVGPDGRRYIWVFIPSRNQWVVADRDRHTATFQTLLNYTVDVIQSYDDGNSPGNVFGDEVTIAYYIDFLLQAQTQQY
jgi:hypothetical protein